MVYHVPNQNEQTKVIEHVLDFIVDVSHMISTISGVLICKVSVSIGILCSLKRIQLYWGGRIILGTRGLYERVVCNIEFNGHVIDGPKEGIKIVFFIRISY